MAVLPQGLRLQCPSLQEAAYLYDEIIRDDVYFQCGIKVCVSDAGAPLCWWLQCAPLTTCLILEAVTSRDGLGPRRGV